MERPNLNLSKPQQIIAGILIAIPFAIFGIANPIPNYLFWIGIAMLASVAAFFIVKSLRQGCNKYAIFVGAVFILCATALALLQFL